MLKVKDKYDYRAELCQLLRSGKFLQGRGWLHNQDKHCVIGVFEIMMNQLEANHDSYDQAFKLLALPHRFILSDLNDEGRSFEEIATYLEALP